MQKTIFISGPCVIESLENLRLVAKDLQNIANNPNIDFYFKSSFDKANRTSLDSFRGLGIDKGLDYLREIKEEFGYKILTDIHDISQVEKAAKVADILQIPAFLCRQTDLIVEASKSDCIINIKKGQFMSPADMRYSVLKAIKTRGGTEATYEESKRLGIWLCERGNSFGYGTLIVDMRGLSIMRNFAPVIFDATHSVQAPGALKGQSGGDRKFAPILARAAAAVGVDGYFAESHFNPDVALSDGPNMIISSEIADFLDPLLAIQNALNLKDNI